MLSGSKTDYFLWLPFKNQLKTAVITVLIIHYVYICMHLLDTINFRVVPGQS